MAALSDFSSSNSLHPHTLARGSMNTAHHPGGPVTGMGGLRVASHATGQPRAHASAPGARVSSVGPASGMRAAVPQRVHNGPVINGPMPGYLAPAGAGLASSQAGFHAGDGGAAKQGFGVVDTPRFDPSDFPALGGVDTDGKASHSSHPSLSSGGSGHVSNPDFSIQNADDFPALTPSRATSANSTSGSGAPEPHHGTGPESEHADFPVDAASYVRSRPVSGGTSTDSGSIVAGAGRSNGSLPLVSAAGAATSTAQRAVSLPQTAAAGAGAGAGAGTAKLGSTTNKAEKYGLKGLLSVIRMTDPDLNTLALGTDLTTLGLNLNSTEVLYATFAHPTLEGPTRRDPDYVLPYCYYMQPPALKTSHLQKFKPETLFYIFYNMPKDTLQVFAAKELYNRGWRYHKERQLWFTRDDGTKPAAGSGPAPAPGASGPFWYFDTNVWDRRQHREPLPTGHFLEQSEIDAL